MCTSTAPPAGCTHIDEVLSAAPPDVEGSIDSCRRILCSFSMVLSEAGEEAAAAKAAEAASGMSRSCIVTACCVLDADRWLSP